MFFFHPLFRYSINFSKNLFPCIDYLLPFLYNCAFLITHSTLIFVFCISKAISYRFMILFCVSFNYLSIYYIILYIKLTFTLSLLKYFLNCSKNKLYVSLKSFVRLLSISATWCNDPKFLSKNERPELSHMFKGTIYTISFC